MKPNLPLRSVVVLLMSLWFISVSQSVYAASSFQSYAKDVYNLGVGGMPPTLSDFAVNPRAYLRSETAYQSLKQGFEESLNRSLSDAEFSALLASNQVRSDLDCVGRINTAGINQADVIGWSSRKCYFDEKLIELQVNDKWQVVASQGCFNLVDYRKLPVRQIEAAPVEPAEPQIEVTSGQLLRSPKVFIQQTPGITVHLCGCPGNHRCHDDVYLPGYRAILIR
jgi:hypothetical protein